MFIIELLEDLRWLTLEKVFISARDKHNATGIPPVPTFYTIGCRFYPASLVSVKVGKRSKKSDVCFSSAQGLQQFQFGLWTRLHDKTQAGGLFYSHSPFLPLA